MREWRAGNESRDGEAGAGATATPAAAPLNEPEARNLAFILSHRLSREQDMSLMTVDTGEGPDAPARATAVSKRLAALSLRLASDDARAQLGPLDV